MPEPQNAKKSAPKRPPAPNVWEDVPSSEWEDVSANSQGNSLNLPGGTPQLQEAVRRGMAPGAPVEPTKFEEARDPQKQPGFLEQFAPGLFETREKTLNRLLPEHENQPPAPSGPTLEQEHATRSPLYKAGAIAAFPFVDVHKMEEAALVGNKAGVLAPAAQSATMAGLSLTAEPINRASNAAYNRSLARKGVRAYQEVISPSTSKAAEQLDDLETIQRAAPYLSQQERVSPVKVKQPGGGPLAGQRLGVMDYRQNALEAGKKLWEGEIEPRQRAYSEAPINHEAVVNDIRGTLDPNSPADAAKQAAVQNTAEFYNRPTNVGNALDMVKALNEDRAVQAYEHALPDKQAEMLGADPALEAKLKAADSLRDQVFESVKTHGSPEESQYLQEARRDWGALKQVAKNLSSSQVPTPESFFTRLANTARATVGARGARGYVGGRDVETLFRLHDPNRLARTSSRAFGEAGLQPREGPTYPAVPPAPVFPNAPEGEPITWPREPLDQPAEAEGQGAAITWPPSGTRNWDIRSAEPRPSAPSQVGQLPPLGHPAAPEDFMWTPRVQGAQPGFELPEPVQTTPSGVEPGFSGVEQPTSTVAPVPPQVARPKSPKHVKKESQ